MASKHPQFLFENRCVPGYHHIDIYRQYGGYSALTRALSLDRDAVINEIKVAGLRGRGGAGFPTFIKWNGIPKNFDQPHYLVVNADEGEPGTAKDREIMNLMPHLLVEGCIIAAWTIRASSCYIYIRGEYIQPAKKMRDAIAQAYDAGLLGKDILGSGFDLDIHVHMGAGSYECGEETALMSSLMGERGMPRPRPPAAPLPVIEGVWNSPTLINNVETIATVVPILNVGGAEYAKYGTGTLGQGPASRGTKLVSLSGHIKKPGNYEVALGTPVREIIYDIVGGILNDRELKFFIPGGSSVKMLTPEFLDTPYDYESLAQTGSALGSGGLMVFDETVNVPALMTRLSHFYAHESCGKCTPCREGTTWLAKIHDRIMAGSGRAQDIDLLLDICNNIEGRSFCLLGDAAAWPIQGAMKYFRHEYQVMVRQNLYEGSTMKPLPMAPTATNHLHLQKSGGSSKDPAVLL